MVLKDKYFLLQVSCRQELDPNIKSMLVAKYKIKFIKIHADYELKKLEKYGEISILQ